jgi:hypothetical protein
MKPRDLEAQKLIPMPPRVRSLVGMRFGRLRVVAFAGQSKSRHAFWCCECECGNYVRVRGQNLLGHSHGNTVSCGCKRADPAVQAASRCKVLAKRRVEICKTARAAVRDRKPAYSMDAHRAAELLGVSVERIHIMAADGLLPSRTVRGAIWVSSQEVARLVGAHERQAKSTRCPLRAILRGAKKDSNATATGR